MENMVDVASNMLLNVDKIVNHAESIEGHAHPYEPYGMYSSSDGIPQENELQDTGDAPFCVPSMGDGSEGMIMYMDGFRLSLKGEQQCLNLFFPGWTLDSRAKFGGALLLVFFLAVLTEGIAKWRYCLNKRSNKRFRGSPLRRFLITLMHTLQAFAGYILMLATMTFSVELLMSVVLGLGVGYAVFYNDDDRHVTTNPCCNFMQNEEDERNDIMESEIVDTDTANHSDLRSNNSASVQDFSSSMPIGLDNL